jgi:hypothetical protein
VKSKIASLMATPPSSAAHGKPGKPASEPRGSAGDYMARHGSKAEAAARQVKPKVGPLPAPPKAKGSMRPPEPLLPPKSKQPMQPPLPPQPPLVQPPQPLLEPPQPPVEPPQPPMEPPQNDVVDFTRMVPDKYLRAFAIFMVAANESQIKVDAAVVQRFVDISVQYEGAEDQNQAVDAMAELFESSQQAEPASSSNQPPEKYNKGGLASRTRRAMKRMRFQLLNLHRAALGLPVDSASLSEQIQWAEQMEAAKAWAAKAHMEALNQATFEGLGYTLDQARYAQGLVDVAETIANRPQFPVKFASRTDEMVHESMQIDYNQRSGKAPYKPPQPPMAPWLVPSKKPSFAVPPGAYAKPKGSPWQAAAKAAHGVATPKWKPTMPPPPPSPPTTPKRQ